MIHGRCLVANLSIEWESCTAWLDVPRSCRSQRCRWTWGVSPVYCPCCSVFQGLVVTMQELYSGFSRRHHMACWSLPSTSTQSRGCITLYSALHKPTAHALASRRIHSCGSTDSGTRQWKRRISPASSGDELWSSQAGSLARSQSDKTVRHPTSPRRNALFALLVSGW